MMAWLLLLLGLILIFLEFILPGAILGISGIILTLTGMFIFASEASSWIWVAVYFVAFIFGVIASIWLALRFITKASPGYSVYSNQDQAGYKASEYDASLIGREGIAQTDLKPSGRVLIENRSFQALSQAAYISRGEPIVVIGGQEATLIVKTSLRNNSTSEKTE